MMKIKYLLLLLFSLSAVMLFGQQDRKIKNIHNPLLEKTKYLDTWNQFNKKFKNKWKVRWNSVTGTPHRIYGYYVILPEKITEKNVKRVSFDILTSYKDVLQIDPEKLVLLKTDYSEPDSPEVQYGTFYIKYKQVHNGLSVYGGSARLVIRHEKLTLLGSDYYPGITISTDPEISEKEAMARIKRDIQQKEELNPLESKLIVYPKPISGGIRYYLAWKITISGTFLSSESMESTPFFYNRENREPAEIPVQWQYFIDAMTGNVINRINVLRYGGLNGVVRGMVHPEIPADTELLPIPSMDITLTQGINTYTGTTDSDGYFSITGLSPGNAGLEAQLVGPNVIVFNGETGTVATHTATVPIPGTYDWDWDIYDISENDVETNVFYHVNRIHDWFLRGYYPFNILPDPYPMHVTVRDKKNGNFYCNANAGPEGLKFSGNPPDCEDTGLCADWIYHEYTHCITHKVYDDANIPLPQWKTENMMDEAWSDYFSCSITNSPEWGTECSATCGRNIDTPDKRFPDNWNTLNVHYGALILSGSLWDLRTVLGNVFVDYLAFRGLRNTETSFRDYLGAILEEDDVIVSLDSPVPNNNPTDGTPHIDTICHCFYDLHGIYHEYCAGHTETPVADIVTPDPTIYNLFTGTTIPITGTASGSSTHAFQNFTLEFAPVSEPGDWSLTGMTPYDGGLSSVDNAFLGTWNITTVSDGLYFIRLTVTDTGGNTSSFTTKVVIDKSMMPGWPQAMDVLFFGTPAVADIDPSFPGNEIIACGDDDQCYAWHSDGSGVPGWPVPSYQITSSPAVGDLDNDGTYEIILSSYFGTVYIYNQNGSLIAEWSCEELLPGTPALGDLDGNGDLEIILGSANQNVYALHHDGTPYAQWTLGDSVRSSASIGDLDNDGQVEIVVGADNGKVYALRGNGTIMAEWQVTTDKVSASAALGDLDGDGDLEIVVGSEDKYVYAWHHDGTPAEGWSREMTQYSARPSSAGIADLDSDNEPEIIVMSADCRVHVWEADGTPVDGWPPEMISSGNVKWMSSPSIGDINGDGDMEVITRGNLEYIQGMTFWTVHALHHNAATVPGWPKYLSTKNASSPAIADVDLDGDVEIILGSDGVYVWDLPGAYSTHTIEWPHYRHDMRRTGAYGPKSGLVMLFDTSGSMSWHFNGTMGVPPGEQRLTLAKEASYPFLEILNTFNANKAKFSIVAFPAHPWDYTAGCNGQVVTPMTSINTVSKNTAITSIIPGLAAEGNTPLLPGLETAAGMFGPELNRVIVLLSDGYHNCPSQAGIGSPEMTHLIHRLNSDKIRVFTIGFGRPSDTDHPFLEDFANNTTPIGFSGSQFYDVTAPGFDPATWDPAVALQETYKAILSDTLELQTAADPRGIISFGEEKTSEVRLNEHDRRVSFFLSWITQEMNWLDIKVYSSDGKEVNPHLKDSGVTLNQGKTYKILTVDSSFLKLPGKIGPDPWKIVIRPSSFNFAGHKEKFQYSVILDSTLTMKTGLNKKSFETGDTIKITARVTERGQPVTGLSDVFADIVCPEDGAGNWFVRNRITDEELKKIPGKKGDEILSDLLRKSIYLTDVRKVAFPLNLDEGTFKLYDNGTNGDDTANDGTYTTLFTGTKKEGTYSFYFHASGYTKGGNGFERDDIIQEYIKVGAIVTWNTIKVTPIADIPNYYRITLIPKDRKGNYLGPRYAEYIKLKANEGVFMGQIKDNLDGSYTQVFQVPEDTHMNKIKISVLLLNKKEYSFKLTEKLEKKYSLGFFQGMTVPMTCLYPDYTYDYSFGLMMDYHFKGPLSLLVIAGYNMFSRNSQGISDTFLCNISANVKCELALQWLTLYLNGGSGAYIFESGDIQPGVNAGAGVDVSVLPQWAIVLGGNYHHLFDSRNTEFSLYHLGAIHRF